MRSSAFESEYLLQQLLAPHPCLIAGDAVDPTNPRRWLLIAREQAVPGEEGGSGRWSLDHLFVDQDGVPPLVELKCASDMHDADAICSERTAIGPDAYLHKGAL